MLANLKYKDTMPSQTINKIRNILSDSGILTIETSWKNSAKGFYSVSLNIVNTNFGTNGKGTSYEFALASAYAELLERLQNQAFFRLNNDLSAQAFQYQGFYYAPDEKVISIAELLQSNEDWITKQRDYIDAHIDKLELFKKWKALSYEDVPADFIALPYYNLTNDNISYIPIKMVAKMYMSNGMCAGNTPEEALVQGISEVLERYVNIKIVKEKIVPPDIPRAYLRQYQHITDMLTKIESAGNYSVIIKDCSLNEGLPVVGLIFIDKDEQSYFVKFGAHPVLEIALERTLTELLQGQDISNMMGMSEFHYQQKVNNETDNLIGILVNGVGHYPTEFFSAQYSYEFNQFNDVSKLNNKEMLEYLKGLLQSMGYDILVRNVSVLGFPSFHVIVSGLSEIEKIDDIAALEDYIQYNKVKRYIRKLPKVTAEEITTLINFFGKFNYSHSSIANILNLSIDAGLPWFYTNINLFMAALYYVQGDFQNAYLYIDKYLAYYQQENKEITGYFRCLRDYIGTRIDKLEEQAAIQLLSKIYPADIVMGIIDEFKNFREIFDEYNQFNCFNCELCSYKDNCLYTAVEKLYFKLKDAAAATPIVQSDMKSLLGYN